MARGCQPPADRCARCVRNTEGSVADLTFAPDGTLYYAFPGWTQTDWRSKIYLARSTDLGMTFQTVGVGSDQSDFAHGYTGSNALPSVRVDPGNPNRVYLAWSANYGLWNLGTVLPAGSDSRTAFLRRPYLAVSNDSGRTFSPPIDMAGALKASVTQPSLAIGKNGALFAIFGESQVTDFGKDVKEGHLFVATSLDGGKTFSQEAIHTQPPGNEFTYMNTPAAAVDPTTGNVYVTWEEMTKALASVEFVRSTDQGKTWSNPLKLNDVDPKRTWDFQEFDPWMSVAPNGRIDAAWNDYRNDTAFVPTAGSQSASDSLQDVYYSSSSDGGLTWSANIRVTDRSIDRRLSDVWATGVHGPIGLAATNQRTYFAWDDTRNATADSKAQDIYFTRANVDGSSSTLLATTKPASSAWRGGVIGAGVALAVGGLLLLVVSRAMAGRGPATVGVS